MNPAFLKRLLDTMSDAVICLDSNYKITFINQKAQTSFGLLPDPVPGDSANNVFPSEVEANFQAFLEERYPAHRSSEFNEIGELLIKDKDGKQFMSEVSVTSWRIDESPFYTMVMRDIDEKKREQEALRKAAEFIEGHLENENYRLHEEEKKLLKMQEELRLARDIQQRLLPDEAPQINGYDIAAINIPAKEVGGDYYDFIKVNDNKLFFCLGDVSGKGIPAALLVANLQASLHSQSLLSHSPQICVRNSNKLIYQNTDSNKFITLFYGILDMENHQITYCNGGHDQPVFIANQSALPPLSTGGIPLGFMADFNYQEARADFLPGGMLVLYSDGITEAMNSADEEFGLERLTELIYNHHHLNAGQLQKEILDQVNAFSGDTPQMDDMTLVIVKRTE